MYVKIKTRVLKSYLQISNLLIWLPYTCTEIVVKDFKSFLTLSFPVLNYSTVYFKILYFLSSCRSFLTFILVELRFSQFLVKLWKGSANVFLIEVIILWSMIFSIVPYFVPVSLTLLNLDKCYRSTMGALTYILLSRKTLLFLVINF